MRFVIRQTKNALCFRRESIRQIKIRADRLSVNRGILMISETNFENIDALIDEIEPKVVVIDSIQTVYSEALMPPEV